MTVSRLFKRQPFCGPSAAIAGEGYGNLWLYLVGPLTGAAFAALVFRLQHAGAMD